MQTSKQAGKTLFLVTAAVLTVAALVVAGCTAGTLTSSNGTTINTATTTVPISITDAPGDQVLAATLTLNSVVLKDSSGGTASLLTSPVTFEATHLDAVQEPLFVPSVPQATYTSVTLTYSNPVIAYIDSTGKVVVANGTLANTSKTITFTNPIVINSTKSALLIDYLVANSVAISGSTVTVTPDFRISAAPIRTQPMTGTEGMHRGVKGKVTALGTNQFTLVNPFGISLTVNVNSNTAYEDGLTAFSGITVGMFVEVDLELQTDGTLLAKRVELEQTPVNPNLAMLVGPVTTVTGTPATSFTQVVRQQVGSTTNPPVQTDTITINSSTKFILPGRMEDISKLGLPFTPTFDASSIFAGQVVAVATNGVTNNAATALGVRLAPQTLAGTIATLPSSSCTTWCQYTITLPSTSWVAILTGKTTVTVYTPPMGMMQDIMPTSTTLAVGTAVRFHGFLFKNNGNLAMYALIKGPGPGTPIDQH